MDSILEVKNIYFSYHIKDGETPALKKVSFDIKLLPFISYIFVFSHFYKKTSYEKILPQMYLPVDRQLLTFHPLP